MYSRGSCHGTSCDALHPAKCSIRKQQGACTANSASQRSAASTIRGWGSRDVMGTIWHGMFCAQIQSCKDHAIAVGARRQGWVGSHAHLPISQQQHNIHCGPRTQPHHDRTNLLCNMLLPKLPLTGPHIRHADSASCDPSVIRCPHPLPGCKLHRSLCPLRRPLCPLSRSLRSAACDAPRSAAPHMMSSRGKSPLHMSALQ